MSRSRESMPMPSDEELRDVLQQAEFYVHNETLATKKDAETRKPVDIEYEPKFKIGQIVKMIKRNGDIEVGWMVQGYGADGKILITKKPSKATMTRKFLSEECLDALQDLYEDIESLNETTAREEVNKIVKKVAAILAVQEDNDIAKALLNRIAKIRDAKLKENI